MEARRRWHFQTTTLNLSSSSSLSNDQRTKISNCEAIFSNGSICSLAGGTGSWAWLWAAVQACHMARLRRAGHRVGLQLLPQAPKDNHSALGNKAASREGGGAEGAQEAVLMGGGGRL